MGVAERVTVTRVLLGMVRDGTDERELAGRICEACVRGLDVDGAAMSVLTTTPSRETLWATDATAELLEELQFTLDEGACMEAANTGAPVFVPDLHHGTGTARWPLFAAAVAERSRVCALFALPLQWGPVNLGVLDLYRDTPGALTDDERSDAISAVDTAALMLLGLRTDPGEETGGWLDRSMGHRAEVHQATGMVIAQLGLGPTDALARLRAHAFVTGRLLLDVAHDVVRRTIVFSEDMT